MFLLMETQEQFFIHIFVDIMLYYVRHTEFKKIGSIFKSPKGENVEIVKKNCIKMAQYLFATKNN